MSPCASVARETRRCEGFRQCERTPCVPKKFRLSRRRKQTRVHCCFWLAALFHCGALRRPCRRCPSSSLKDDFFLKMVPDIRHLWMKRKIACVVIRFSVATVVTTENHMTMRFFSSSMDARCPAPILKKNRIFFLPIGHIYKSREGL